MNHQNSLHSGWKWQLKDRTPTNVHENFVPRKMMLLVSSWQRRSQLSGTWNLAVPEHSIVTIFPSPQGKQRDQSMYCRLTKVEKLQNLFTCEGPTWETSKGSHYKFLIQPPLLSIQSAKRIEAARIEWITTTNYDEKKKKKNGSSDRMNYNNKLQQQQKK